MKKKPSAPTIGNKNTDLSSCFGMDAVLLQHRLRRTRHKTPAFWQDFTARINRSEEFVTSRRENSPRPEYPEELPVSTRRDEIAKAIKNNQVVIIAGETGSGKTTQLPKICLELGLGIKGLIGCTQPRRVAAVSVAERVASELQGQLGEAVGYQVRFDDKFKRDTYIKFMTDGILLSQTRGDPDLLEYDTLIIDEAHERSLNIDFILGYLKRLIPRRPDLKIIISSATLEVERFSEFFSGAPIITVEGRTYPVDIVYTPPKDDDTDTPVWIGHVMQRLFQEFGPGDTLIFMTGEQEIRETVNHLEKRNLPSTEVLPLYSRLSPAEQRRVFHPGSKRRIIVSTNVAETSVTVPMVRYVIDTGLARIKRFNPRTGVERLQAESISQASARQRSGRCGRIGPGICARLYEENDFLRRPEYTDPEIKRSSLAGVILQMELLRLGRVEDFPFIEPPSGQLVRSGYDELQELGALDEERRLTPRGKRIAALPIEPRLGRMLLTAAENNLLNDTIVITAALSVQDPRLRPPEKKDLADQCHRKYRNSFSDFTSWLKLWREIEKQQESGSNNKLHKWCKDNFLSYLRVREWGNIIRQLNEEMNKPYFNNPAKQQPKNATENTRINSQTKKGAKDTLPDEELHKVLLSGLLSRVGKYHEEDKLYRGSRDTRFHIWPGSGLSGSKQQWIMAAEIVDTSRPFARCCAAIKNEWLENLGGHLLKKSFQEPYFDEKSGLVRANMNATLFGLPVIENRPIHYGPIDPDKSREVFIRQGILQQKLSTKCEFYRNNTRLIEKIETAQNKLRRGDLLVDEESIFTFYDRVIPHDIYTQKALERFAERDIRENKKLLFMCERDICLQNAQGLSENLFPTKIRNGGFDLALNYRFDPAHPQDGVNCTIPLGALSSLDTDRFDWLVPGLLGEKTAQLLRTLPRTIRRDINPIPETVEKVLPLLQKNSEGKLYTAIADILTKHCNVRVIPDDFRPQGLPPFLRMHFCIIDSRGKTVAQGRDIEELRKNCSDKEEQNFTEAPKEKLERKNLREWNFTLQQQIRLPGGAGGYPGLREDGNIVSLRIFQTAEEAQRLSRKGICRLAWINIEDQLRKVIKSLPLQQKALMYYATVKGNTNELKESIITASIWNLYDKLPKMPRTKNDFNAFIETLRREIYQTSYNAANSANMALISALELHSKLIPQKSPQKNDGIKEIKLRLNSLIHPFFVMVAGTQQLEHFPRYVRGYELRLQKLLAQPMKDRERAASINSLWNECLNAYATVQKRGIPLPELIEYRWLLEEYSLSVFSQEVGATEGASLKKLNELWTIITKKIN